MKPLYLFLGFSHPMPSQLFGSSMIPWPVGVLSRVSGPLPSRHVAEGVEPTIPLERVSPAANPLPNRPFNDPPQAVQDVDSVDSAEDKNLVWKASAAAMIVTGLTAAGIYGLIHLLYEHDKDDFQH